MNAQYLIIALTPVVVAIIAAVWCRGALVRRLITTILALFGYFAIASQGQVLARSKLPISSPSSEYRDGYMQAAIKLQDQRPMVLCAYLALFVLAMFPLKEKCRRSDANTGNKME